jgi:hypothetical protein
MQSSNTALLEDFRDMRLAGNGGPIWRPGGVNSNQTVSIVQEDGDARLRVVVTGWGSSGPGSDKAVQVQFYPNQGSPRYPFPAGFTRSYLRDGATFDPLFNRLSLWIKCDQNITWEQRETMILGTYIKSHDSTNLDSQGAHYYNFISTKMTANKWVKIQYTWHPGSLVGQSGATEWGSDPEYPPTHYFDGLTRFYLDMKYANSFPLTCWFDDLMFSRDDNQNDELIPSMAAHYDGLAYYIGFNTIKHITQNYEVRYSTASMKANGFDSGTFGAMIANWAGAYTGTQWTSPPMAENPNGMYFAIRPEGQSDFMELYLPAGAPNSGGLQPQSLVGDLNADGTVNTLDWSIMEGAWFTASQPSDINLDGVVNSIDFSLMNANWGRSQ